MGRGKEGILNLSACVARAPCKRANFVSFLRLELGLSWYASCDFAHLCADCSTPGLHCPPPPGCPSYVPYASEVIKAPPPGPPPAVDPKLFVMPYIKQDGDRSSGVLLISKSSVPTNVTLTGAGLAGAAAVVLDGSVDGVTIDPEPGFVAPVARLVGDDGFLSLGPYAIAVVDAGPRPTLF